MTYHVIKVSDATRLSVAQWEIVIVKDASSETSPNQTFVRAESYAAAKQIADHMNGVI